jgi:hypothetical protein
LNPVIHIKLNTHAITETPGVFDLTRFCEREVMRDHLNALGS